MKGWARLLMEAEKQGVSIQMSSFRSLLLFLLFLNNKESPPA